MSIVYCHDADADGYCSMQLAQMVYYQQGYEFEQIGYQDTAKLAMCFTRFVFIDISPNLEWLVRLLRTNPHVEIEIYDHHFTAYEMISKAITEQQIQPESLKYFYEDKMCGAMIFY